MVYLTTNENVRNAVDKYLETHQVDDFAYDGLVGFEAFDLFLTMNDEFTLDFVCAYLDIINNMKASWPKLPMIV